MKTGIVKIISVLLGVLMMLGAMKYRAADEGLTAEVWDRVDVILRSAKKYDNPYTDVQIDAVFTHESGESIKLYGFWYGGDEWRVRFSPTKTGVWDYVVTCTDEDDAGLHNVRGRITAKPNTGKTMIDRHGFVRVSDNGRYFTYDDGTPFYWLGDTNWQAPNYVTLSACNYPGCSCGNQFLHELNDRAAKGFTVYQTYFDSSETDGGGQRSVTTEPSMWLKKYDKIDPDTFRRKFDVMFDYLAARGMVIALGFGVHSLTTGAMSASQLDTLSRYLTARYASYPVVWITAQEITGDPQFDRWVSSARITAEGDGYHHPHGAHQFPLECTDKFIAKLDGEKWHTFYALQNGHGPVIPSKSTYKGYYNNKRLDDPKPFVETEANYEDIYCGGFNGYNASRIAAWKANLCGSCGFTYGATGVWANCWSTAGSTGWMGTFSTEPWYMGIEKPGSFEMKYMAEFFDLVGFERLVPRFSASAYSDFKAEDKVVASSDNADTYVAYFYNPDRTTGKLKGLTSDAYGAYWYDVKTGKYIDAGGVNVKNGVYEIPEKPDGGDWVLLVTSRTVEGIKTEPSRVAASDTTENLLDGCEASASSQSTPGNAASMAVDGKAGTWWCASDGTFPQWLIFDMKKPVTFNTLSLQMYEGTGAVSCTVEGSDDGKTWSRIYKTVKEAPAPGSYAVGAVFEREYTYRFIRVTFDSVSGNWAAVIDAKLGLKKTSALPAYKGELQIPGAECVGSSRYTAAGVLKETASRLTDGDITREWKPFAVEATQTIILDMYEEKDVYGINVIMGEGSPAPAYRIEGSTDGCDWYVLKDAEVNGYAVYSAERYGERAVLSEELTGRYRYIKLIVMGSSVEYAKTIGEIELYADGKTPSAPEAPDLSALVSLYKKCARLKNDGEYDGGRYRNFLYAVCEAAYAVSSKTQDPEAHISALQTALDVLNGAEPEDTATDAVTDEPPAETGETEIRGKKGNIIPVVAACAAAALIGAAVVFIIRKKRKK